MDRGEDQAYPVAGSGYMKYGMTLREYIAASAMEGLLGNNDNITNTYVAHMLGISPFDYKEEIHFPQYIAKRAVLFADELLKQLEK